MPDHSNSSITDSSSRSYPFSLCGPGPEIIAGEIVILPKQGFGTRSEAPNSSRDFVITRENVLSVMSDKNSDWMAKFREDALPFVLNSCRKWMGRTVVPVMIAGSMFFMPVSMPAAHAATITVNDMSDTGTGCTLRKAIVNANKDTATFAECVAGTGDDTISIPAGTYTLSKELPLIIGNTVLQGAGIGSTFVDGAGKYRAFFVGYTGKTPSAALKNMTIRNANAKGGDGSGGGAGLGAGLFVYSGNVSVESVRFTNNKAIGGNGSSNNGGGGGFGGNGGTVGGGGFDTSAVGGGVNKAGNSISGGSGVVGGGGGSFDSFDSGGVGSYGSGGNGNSAGIGNNGTFGGGGGGGTTRGGSGGIGGGGGFCRNDYCTGGNGGFGGGGGSGAGYGNGYGGNGGFGGGGGIGGYLVGAAGNGGFGGGNGSNTIGGYGGGGAGFGGAVFAKNGTLTLKTVTFDSNGSAGGTGSPTGGQKGKGKGGAIFICDASVGGNDCGATVSADSCGVTLANDNTAPDNAGTTTDNVNVFGTLPAGATTACAGAGPGDVNGDGNINLADAIEVLQIIAGINPLLPINLGGDVNGDGKIGMEEEVYILQRISTVR